jgi:hypothetical protein
MQRIPPFAIAVALVLVGLFGATPALAQLNTQHIKGTVGLKAGSQPPPHWYLVAPLIYVYNTDTIRGREGNKLPLDADLTTVVYGAGVALVTNKKLFGANYGFQALFAGANNRIQGTEIDFNPGGGISDTAFQRLQLGWHFARADAIAGYTLFVPTGRYTDGASDNTGFGMWGHELSGGTTVYLTKSRQYHAATIASFDFQSKKQDSETKVGNQMNLEGGVGGDFLRGGLTVGLSYYAAFKLSDDDIGGIPGQLIRGKNKVFALGPEVSLALARGGVLYGFLKANFQWETYARTTTQGSAFSIMATFPLGPIKLPEP